MAGPHGDVLEARPASAACAQMLAYHPDSKALYLTAKKFPNCLNRNQTLVGLLGEQFHLKTALYREIVFSADAYLESGGSIC
jgi:hypothetical protein